MPHQRRGGRLGEPMILHCLGGLRYLLDGMEAEMGHRNGIENRREAVYRRTSPPERRAPARGRRSLALVSPSCGRCGYRTEVPRGASEVHQ